jgi:His-Xaa-Ser system radical SAM maturase HxsC
MRLWGKLKTTWAGPSFLGRIFRGTMPPNIDITNGILIWERPTDELPELPADFKLVLTKSPCSPDSGRLQQLPEWMSYLETGDLIHVAPTSGAVRVLHRGQSMHNSYLLTEQCNSHCLMCSQPPKETEDRARVIELIKLFKMAPRIVRPIGLTGGEPLLCGELFLELLDTITSYHPNAPIHILSNGRLFARTAWAKKIAAIATGDLMFGIPLYSDIARRHDFVVQAKGAFDEAILGILALKDAGIAVEIRNVLHMQTVDRLRQFARFIVNNLRFVDHVAMMGLEGTGHTKMNLNALWIDPLDYAADLDAAVRSMARAGVPVSIYNLQHCILPESAWPYSRQSISDWKNAFDDACAGCEVRSECAGFFTSGTPLKSAHISPVKLSDHRCT